MSNVSASSSAGRWRPNEGETAVFQFANGRRFVVRSGCVTMEAADGVIVPTNTEFVVSGAADAVLRVVEKAMSDAGIRNDVFDLLFRVTIKNPPPRLPSSVLIDDALRNAVGELGSALISETLRGFRLNLTQGWDRIIAAFVRSQSRPPAFQDTLSETSVAGAMRTALRLAAECGLKSVVTVPFGTGLRAIDPERSAEFMAPAITEFLQSDGNSSIETVIVVEHCPGSFEAFSLTTKRLLGIDRYSLRG